MSEDIRLCGCGVAAGYLLNAECSISKCTSFSFSAVCLLWAYINEIALFLLILKAVLLSDESITWALGRRLLLGLNLRTFIR